MQGCCRPSGTPGTSGRNADDTAATTTPTTPTTPPTTHADTDGESGSDVVAVPIAFTGNVGVSADVNLGLFFSDPDGDTLAYTATSNGADVATVSVAGIAL